MPLVAWALAQKSPYSRSCLYQLRYRRLGSSTCQERISENAPAAPDML